MGCAAGRFERRCKTPCCAYVPQTDGYCCSNCQKMHDGSLQWDVKTNINTRSANEDIQGHDISPLLPWLLARLHVRGWWQDIGTAERGSFIYLALVRNGKELHCRKISGKEPVPRAGLHFEIVLDRGMVLVQDAKVGDQFHLKYQVGKQCRLLASGISVTMVQREIEDVEHETECQQVTAGAPSTGRCRNPTCSFVSETQGFCCASCRETQRSSTVQAMRNLREVLVTEEFQSLPGAIKLKSATHSIYFHCWWRSDAPSSELKLCLLRKKLEMASIMLSDSAPKDWQLLQKVIEKDHPMVQEAEVGDELQLQYKVGGKLEVKQITVTSCFGDFKHDESCNRFAAASRSPFWVN